MTKTEDFRRLERLPDSGRPQRLSIGICNMLILAFAAFWPQLGRPWAACCAETLRVITYNVQFLPDPVADQNERPQPNYRSRRIAEEAAKYEIVALQETFHPRHRQQIIEGVRAAWKGQFFAHQSPQPEGFFTNGGCLLLSRLPVGHTSSIVFANFSKPEQYGLRADGFAAKGVIHARVVRTPDLPGEFIEVFVTHLEARADHLRPLQYAELAKFIRETADTARPFLLLGDLNTRGMKAEREDPQSQYSVLMRELRTAWPAGEVIDVWPALRGDALGGTTEQESSDIGKRIDYIIVGNPPGNCPQLKPISVTVELFRDAQVGALSDHNAVVGEFRWQ